MTEVENTSRPMSCASARIPSQAGVKAAFSRPVTAGEDIVNSGGETEPEVEEADLIDQVLITQLKEAVSDPPLKARIRFRRCHDKFDNDTPEPTDIFNDGAWDTDLDSDDGADYGSEEPTLSQLYITVCRQLGVVPVSYFARNIEESSVSLKYRAMIASETAAIAKAFKSLLMIEQLDLEGNMVGNRGCRCLCEMLEDNHVLRDLSIAENNLDDNCVRYINNMLAQNGTLKHLSLAANLFTDNSAAAFADCLEDCKLKSMDLSHNRFSERGGVLLGPALSTNVYLDMLNLSWNQIRGAGAVAVAKGLKENVHLAVCNLSWNGFSELGGIAIADALLVNTNLKEIDLSSNRLTYVVAVRIAKVLATNEVLEILKMANNPISTNGCLTLVEAVYKSSTSALKYLDLYENPVEYEFLRVAKALVEKKPDFKVYHGAILRAGNTSEDIGKPSIDIVRLSQKPVMVLKGTLTVNDPEKVRKWMAKNRIKANCTVEQFTRCLQQIDDTLNKTLSNKQLADAIAKLARDEQDKIILSEIL